jgi:predicted PurR-regulated permease PerM
MFLLEGILIPFLIAFLVAYILDPLVDFLEKRGVRRGLAVGLVATVLFTVFLLIMSILVPAAYQEISEFYEKIPEYKEVIKSWVKESGLLKQFNILLDEILNSAQKNFSKILGKTTGQIINIFKFVGGAISFLVKFLIFSLISIYILYDIDNLKNNFKELVPLNLRKDILGILGDIDSMLKHFLRGQLTVGLITGALYSIGLVLSGIDFAIFIGFASGLLNFIPYFGPLTGIIPAVTFSLLAYHTMPEAIYHLIGIGLTFGIVQIIEGTVLTPMIVGEELKLNPITIILSVLIFGKLMGVLGILIALPTISVLKVIFDRTLIYYKQTDFYSGKSKKD